MSEAFHIDEDECVGKVFHDLYHDEETARMIFIAMSKDGAVLTTPMLHPEERDGDAEMELLASYIIAASRRTGRSKRGLITTLVDRINSNDQPVFLENSEVDEAP